MRILLWLVLIALAAGCAKKLEHGTTEEFFMNWLKNHGETNIVVDAGGVGIANSPTRLRASLYGSNKKATGNHVVEIEFRIILPSKDEIIEYVGGMGTNELQAVDDSLANFLFTTFHVVYKSFMNPSDPHQGLEEMVINGQTRQVAMGDLYSRRSNNAKEPLDLDSIRAQIRKTIGILPLSGQPHWIKLVYYQVDGKPMTVSATVDNEEHSVLTSAIKDIQWPKLDGYYLAKQFIVIK